MRRSEWEDRCNRHPDHRTSKGVCPYCLRDHLARLSASASAAPTTRRASSSSSSATTSACSSGGSSPPRHRAALSADVSSVHVVAGSSFADAASSSFADAAAFSQPLMPTSASKKPPPTAAAAAAGRRDEAAQPARGKAEVRRKKIGRFLSRLVGAEKRRHTGDGGGELVHSKTMKEKTAFKWVFF
ncbi:uncharacterized protein LOC100382983 [Zea mays]|jgi:BRCT domain type II-containing protein|uniref:Uncharacterized protein n=1 Tax=Zea mays TaxID=4577 RepID=C0PC51_MAIZE|nr:uncharacterized protein LOC100382983 [Zea mays]ACN31746.1 unknown [Zea mays]AQL09151.1 hypothetical protein ZEAMMB73_Zm00001d048226 [Zea mays]|eukprot:NP_001169138.1 uncharacterized protein LOC100382983 [Zea mays]